MQAEKSDSCEASKRNIYSSNLVVQFSKERQYGLEGTGCHICYLNPTTDVEFEVSRKNVNGFDHYSYSENHNKQTEDPQTTIKDHIVYRLWLYCIGIILIAIGLCLIIIGTINNIKAPYPTTAGENLRLYNSNNVTVRPRASVSTNFVQTITSFERTGGHWKDMLASKKLTTTKASSTTKSLNHHSSNAVQVVSSKNPFSEPIDFEGSGDEYIYPSKSVAI